MPPYAAPYAARPRMPVAKPVGVDAIRLAAILMLIGAVWSAIERRVLGGWLALDPATAQDYSIAGVQLLLAVALLQGSEGARKFVLWITGLAIVGILGGVPLLGESRLWIIGGLWILGFASYFGLVLSRRVSMPSAIFAVLAIAGSWSAVTVSLLVSLGGPDSKSVEDIQKWASPERSFRDEVTGLSMTLPDGWVFLRDGNPIVPEVEGALRVLASTQVTAFALLIRDDAGNWLGLDRYLDEVLAKRQKRESTTTEEARVDVKFGNAPARRMSTSWSSKFLRLRGDSTVWRDADRFFQLTVWYPAAQAEAAQKELLSLERGITFSAPVDTLLKEKVAEVAPACPLLSVESIKVIARKLPKDAPPGAYFRQGYAWAVRGQKALGSPASEDLRRVMGAVFDSLPDSRRARFGEYSEKLTAGQQTTADEDRTMNELLATAIHALPEAEQTKLRQLTEQAIAIGHLL